MFHYALNNLLSKKVRSLLSIVLLSMVLGGSIGLISLSSGMRGSVNSSLSHIEGIVVISKGSADPLFSTVSNDLVEKIRAIEGVKVATPEVWGVVFQLDGVSPMTKGWFSMAAYGGVDAADLENVRGGGLYGRAVVEGRFIRPGDSGHVVMSRKLAKEYGKSIGDELTLNGSDFQVVGIYHTGSLFLDQSILMSIEDARRLKRSSKTAISDVYVETNDESESSVRAAAEKIAALDAEIEAKTKYDWHEDFGSILGKLDAFFVAQSAYVAVLGVIVVLMTMTMSVMERTREFGILKAVGWTRAEVMRLVILESVMLGSISGIVGCAAGAASAFALGGVLPFKPMVTPFLVLTIFFCGLVLGLIGGIYPAYRASSLNPVEAIRTG